MSLVEQKWIDGLASADASVRLEAAEEIGLLGEDAQEAAVVLVQADGDEDEQVLEAVNSALEGLGAPDSKHVSELSRLLSHQSAQVGYWAATLLGRLGPEGGDAVDSLVAVTQSGDPAVQQRATWALGKIGSAD